jgi:hypothetical protein
MMMIKNQQQGPPLSPSSDTTVPSSSGSSSGGSDSLDSSVSDDVATVVLVPEQVPASIWPTDWTQAQRAAHLKMILKKRKKLVSEHVASICLQPL